MRTLTTTLLALGLSTLTGCATEVEADADVEQTASELSREYDAARGAQLATLAARRRGRPSGGRCYEHVYYAIRDSRIATPASLDRYGVGYGGAYDFAEWANANPRQLAEVGFVKDTIPVEELPRGAILVWRPGQCGYSSTYGHIEIVAEQGGRLACSDFCGTVARGCGAPFVYVPIR